MIRQTYIILLIGCLSACQKPVKNTPLFTLIPADSTGIHFSNDLVHTPEFNMYTYRNFYNGGGVGLGDINNDGLVDIFFCGNLVDNKLYLNQGNLTFKDITKLAGVASENIWSSGVSFADINGDGWLDIYICKSGKPGGEKRHNELFINNGDLTFSEHAKEYGIADEGLSSHAAFFDYDHDGDLDLYLLNNSMRSVGGYDLRPGQREIRDSLGGNKLYRNNLANEPDRWPAFEDVSEAAGIYGSNIGFGLGVTIGDLDRDGWQDIYVSNDFFERDYLYINQHDGTFREDLVDQMKEISMGSMGADMADINNDGFPEIFVTEMLPVSDARYKTKMTFENWAKHQLNVNNGYHHQFARNVLQLNNGDQTFSEIGRLANVHASDWSWGALVADFDNDGLKDIYISNGIFKDLLDQDYINFYANDPEILEAMRNKEPDAILRLIDKIPSEPISNFAFSNNGDLTFSDRTNTWGLSIPSFSNGSAYGDLDNDGDLDLVVNNCNMTAFVFENHCENFHTKFLQLTLKGTSLNTNALGAQVTIRHQGKVYFQELSPMRGFQSCIDPKLTFGLDTLSKVDTLEIQWPGGKVSRYEQVSTNQHLILHEKDALIDHISKKEEIPNSIFHLLAEDLFDFQHYENPYVDFDRDRLLLHMVSAEGPKVCQGDVNGDGLPDLFIGGARGQSGQLFLQNSSGLFARQYTQDFDFDKFSEDQEVLFFDTDNDGDLDLLVSSGGNESVKGTPWLQDRLYINDGQGHFQKRPDAFSENFFESSSCVSAGDFDADGDLDLFVGTRLLPGVYGVPVSGILWQNDGKGYFSNVTDQLAPDLKQLGLITDACWSDLDFDGWLDLAVVGEWMPISIFKNNGKSLINVTKQAGLDQSNGLWNCVQIADLNADGALDLVIGNHGLNSRLKASLEKPLTLYINDFDKNRTAEQILTMYNGDRAYPMALRHDLIMQLPGLKKKYLYYENYREQTIDSIFSDEEIRTAAKVQVFNTATSVAWNLGNGRFKLQSLPIEAQLSPTYALCILNINHDQYPDIVLGGNFLRSKPEIGTYNASYGLVLEGSADQRFLPLSAKESGLHLTGEVRAFELISRPDSRILIAFRNNEKPLFFEYPLDGN